MKTHYLTCASSSSVDAKTSHLSLFHVLDEIAATTFPLRLTSFCVAALFEREPGDGAVQSYMLTISLEDRLLASFAMQVEFTRSRRNRSVNTIQGLTIPAPGLLKIDLVQKTNVLAQWRLFAVQVGETAATPKTAAEPPRKEASAPAPRPRPTVN